MEAVHYSEMLLDFHWGLTSIISQKIVLFAGSAYCLFLASFLPGLTFEPEDGGSMFLQIVGAPVLYYTALHARI
jgi:hypothetical protein